MQAKAATERFRGQPQDRPGQQPRELDGRAIPSRRRRSTAQGDPQAGVKIMWDFAALRGDGHAHFFYSYWDRGEQLPLYYEGTGQTVLLAHRVEPEYLEKSDGDLFRGEKRKFAFGVDVTAPFDARGIQLLSYRYKSSDKPRDDARNDDTWVYVPTLRRVRRISTAQRTDAISGTDFTFDDLRSFNGIVPQYEWQCLAERKIIAPMNTKAKGYPYEKEHNFGPYGLSYADDRWELRDAWVVRMIPEERRPPLSPQGHLHRQADARPALLLRLRPEGGALEDHLAQQALERGQATHGRVVPRLGGGPGAAGPARHQRHHRQRPDRNGQPDRVLGRPRHAPAEQGQDPPLHRRRAPDQGPLITEAGGRSLRLPL